MQEIRIMPKAVALWLLLNTQLSKKQICDFCQINSITLDNLERSGVTPSNPITDTKELTMDEIKRCEKNSELALHSKIVIKKSRKYTSAIQKKDIPGILSWLSQNKMKIDVYRFASLSGTNTTYVKKVLDQITNGLVATSVDPIKTGFFAESELDEIIIKEK